MAVEARRGCGYRRVGGMYLVGGSLSVPCDRLPYPIPVCPICGQGVKVGRSFTRIIPLKLFGLHDGQHLDHLIDIRAVCKDKYRPCFMCDPTEDVAFMMLVGGKYYSTASFMEEANVMGVSKRIPFIPKELVLGKTIIYLAHNKACLKDGDGEPDRQGKIKMLQESMGIFSAFIPQRIEKLFWKSELAGTHGEDLRKKLEKQGITPISIPDGDIDHC